VQGTGIRDKEQGTRNKVQGTRDKGQGTRYNLIHLLIMSQELEDRFQNFAKRVRDFCRRLKWDVINIEYIRQLIRASASIGANYIEASDDIGRADERMKIKISRREAKESVFFLGLVLIYEDENLESERQELIGEGIQIRKILSSILNKLAV
jgi:four helix bundle protein